jgi:hypothetical protein
MKTLFMVIIALFWATWTSFQILMDNPHFVGSSVRHATLIQPKNQTAHPVRVPDAPSSYAARKYAA